MATASWLPYAAPVTAKYWKLTMASSVRLGLRTVNAVSRNELHRQGSYSCFVYTPADSSSTPVNPRARPWLSRLVWSSSRMMYTVSPSLLLSAIAPSCSYLDEQSDRVTFPACHQVRSLPARIIRSRAMPSLPDIPGVDPTFLEHCVSVVDSRFRSNARDNTRGPVSPVSQLALQAAEERIKNHQNDLLNNYSDAPEPGPEAYPLRRELHTVNDHPIIPHWDRIRTSVEAYLDRAGQAFTAVMGVGFGHQAEKHKPPFCPMIMTICVKPETVAFKDAKAIADYVKAHILGEAGFPDTDVAIWEFTTTFSSVYPKLPSLDPMFEGTTAEFRHPFASTLGIPIAPFKDPRYEGTVGLFLTQGNGKEDILALTAAHVARPPPIFIDNTGVAGVAFGRVEDEIIVLGTQAYQDAVSRIERMVGLLVKHGNGKRSVRVDPGLSNWMYDFRRVMYADRHIPELSPLHTGVTKYMSITDNRRLGYILFADPIGASSNGPNAFTNDWAVIKVNNEAFALENFRGNAVFVGDRLDNVNFLHLMYPYPAERAEHRDKHTVEDMLHTRDAGVQERRGDGDDRGVAQRAGIARPPRLVR
ncbi:hypothetical protein NUW54_g2213 [Trametes sanguinea]|uniref:Uncharacterized protein n=1 Tax=Trametes sanguinea TaxID=158606 RepID=A0ACC1Q7B9_9APHY|nr:hypothetical protein NUW54_g2213 [Trametes sanguinea]